MRHALRRPASLSDCRGAIAGQSTCPHCGLDLTSAEVRQLWQTLLQADELLARATLTRDRAVLTPPPQAAADPFTAAPQPPQGPRHRRARRYRRLPPHRPTRTRPTPRCSSRSPPKERQWSVGTVLLVLGAFGLIVAGLIFVTRSWEDIGLAGKTLILLGVTAIIGLLGVWVTRRPLRASAEAVWTVFLALLTLDFFAARHEGLAGLDAVEIDWAWVVWGVIAAGARRRHRRLGRKPRRRRPRRPGDRRRRRHHDRRHRSGAVVDDWDFGWRAIVALVVAGLLALSTRPAGFAP